MLRIMIALLLVLGVLWFMLKDGDEKSQALHDQAAQIDLARQAVKSTEQMSASMAEQSDAIRDQAQAGSGGGENIRDTAMGVATQDASAPDPEHPEQ